MTISEFRTKENPDNYINDYLKPRNIIKGIQFKDFAPNSYETFLANKTSILVSFFEDIKNKIEKLEFENLSENLFIFYFDPFTKENVSTLIEIFDLINNILKNQPKEVKSDLLDFYWKMLDHILSYDIYDRFNDQIIALKKFVATNSIFQQENELLIQKIEHYNL